MVICTKVLGCSSSSLLPSLLPANKAPKIRLETLKLALSQEGLSWVLGLTNADKRCSEVLPEALLQRVSSRLLSFCANRRKKPFTTYFLPSVHTFVLFTAHYTPLRLAQAPALPSFTHLRLSPVPGRPPALSKPPGKCGTVRALLCHEYRASGSVCPILAWFCPPARQKW